MSLDRDDFQANDATGLAEPLIESSASDDGDDVDSGDVSYWGLWKHHSEYRWYLLSCLVTDMGE